MLERRYPKIHIRSKNELAKHLSDHALSEQNATDLINTVKKNFDILWRDHPQKSEPKKGKWVRDASYTKLGKLQELISNKILKPYDTLLPDFIFGGVSKKDHKAAVIYLLGKKRKRILLKLDIKKFYEHIREERVCQLLMNKCSCSYKGAKLLSSFCCVPYGSKKRPKQYKTIARGFATSSRLATWCNLDTFIKLERLIKKELKHNDPRICIYVDDIGITASKTSKEDMIHLYLKIQKILTADKNQKLPLNTKKTEIVYHTGLTYDIKGNYVGKYCFEHLGSQMNRNNISLGSKSRWKLVTLKEKLKDKKTTTPSIKKTKKSLMQYKNYIEH